MTVLPVREHISNTIHHAKIEAQDLRRRIHDDQNALTHLEAIIAEYEATLIQLGQTSVSGAVPETVSNPDIGTVLA